MRLSFATAPTPIGVAFAVTSHAGLRMLRFSDDPVPERPRPEEWMPDLRSGGREAHLRAGALSHDPDALHDVFAQVDEYFSGARRQFDLPLDLSEVTGFTRDALEAIRTIAYGQTAAYGEVAILAGRPRAARAVGSACRHSPISLVIPVHRVVRADGTIGDYAGREEIKRKLIEFETAHTTTTDDGTDSASLQ